MAAAHSASGHAAQRGANMHYPQQLPASPGSPTLTNPDMILPDYDRAASPDLPQSALMWKTDHHPNMQFSLSSQGFVAGPITPTTPIIYGNGTMLSDIGEVTEVESTVGKPTYQHGRRFSEDSIDARVAIRSSPTMGKTTGPYESVRERARKANYERRSSIESTSTITTQDRNAIFADFDDSVSVGDSNFQGDDEESLASSYHDDDDEPQVSDGALKSRLSSGTLRSEDRFSTMSLSKRAEEILANAKRRLTTMEGNLSRARSVVSPLRSIDPDTPSPPFDRPSTVMETPITMTTTTTTTSSNSHTRMMSETGMSLTTEIQAGVYPRRSASALGVAGGYRRPLQTLQGSRSFDHMRDRDTHIKDSLSGGFEKANVKALPLHEPALSPLTEDDIPPRDDLLMPEDKGSKLETFLSPTFGSFQVQSVEEIPRAASAAQVRDLKDQMKDLKGKISSLREQARVDSLKRRSLQSLRTPSPFTHSQVDQWYAEHRAYKATNSNLNEERSPWNGEEESAAESQQHGSGSDPAKPIYDVDSPEDSVISEGGMEFRGLSPPKLPMNNSGAMGSQTSLAIHHIPAPIVEEAVEDEDDMKTEDGIEGYDEEEFNSAYENESESGDSLYHEAVQEQISHEDREDAFDYEHFFLHSAMGTIRRRDTMDSYSSEGSVETTKGPIISSAKGNDKPQRPTIEHVRSNSVASTSTMESFATATEGRHSIIYEDVMEDYVEQVVTLPPKSRSSGERTPLTAKRTSFSPPVSTSNVLMHKGRSSLDESRSQYREKNPNVIRRPNTSADNYNMHNMHRPSVSSFESVGTTRSFPLVNRPKNGILTPQGSPDSELKTISDTLLNETASICESKHSGAPIDVLAKDDQILVQRLVESLGKCVLGLSENSKASSEARMYRRRVEAARRLLEGLEGPA